MAMEHHAGPQAQPLSIDIYYFWRCLKKNLYVILLCSILAGVGAYIITDLMVSDSYSSNIHLAVINKGGSNANLNQNNVRMAVSRNISVLNSDSLKTQMNKNTAGLKGTIRASQVLDTNLITLTATSTSAHDVIRLLKVAMDTYPELSGYFGSGYFLKKMDSISASRVVVSHTSPIRNAALGVLLVLAAGIGLTGLFTMYTDRIHTVTQAEQLLDLKILGSLYFSKKKKGQKAILIHDKNTDIAYLEEMDKLATSIQKHMDRNQYKTLMINSIYENEGKTTVAANVALSLARRGKRVVLVDVDLRRPAIYKIFEHETQGEKGLSDFLNDETMALKEILVENTECYGMHQIFQVKATGSAERYLISEKFQKLLKELAKAVDYIILDTPPVGVVQDAEILASLVDAAVLVIRQDMVHAPEINDVVDVFEEGGTTVIGGVLNMVKGEKNSAAGRGRYGNYYYGYGYENTSRR